MQRAPGGGGGWLAARFKCQYSQQLLQVSYKYFTVGGLRADVRKFIARFVSSLLCHREARSAVAISEPARTETVLGGVASRSLR